MSQLAFNEDGDPIELPPVATGWRVKRMRGTRGAPGLVYGADGAPLVLPLKMDIEDLRREVRIPGKYKLEAVDDRRRPLGVEEAIERDHHGPAERGHRGTVERCHRGAVERPDRGASVGPAH